VFLLIYFIASAHRIRPGCDAADMSVRDARSITREQFIFLKQKKSRRQASFDKL
jgi:hypothetical protein